MGFKSCTYSDIQIDFCMEILPKFHYSSVLMHLKTSEAKKQLEVVFYLKSIGAEFTHLYRPSLC